MSTRWNPFYVSAALYLTLALVIAANLMLVNAGVITSFSMLNWMRVHLVVLGGVTQVIFAFAPAFTAARIGTQPPQARGEWRRWVLLNAGIVMVLVGMPVSAGIFTATGATLVFIAVADLVGALWRLKGQGAPRPPVYAYYTTAPFFFLTGILMAIGMVLNWPAPGGYMGMKEAHIHANAWGFLGIMAAGTLLHLFPALVGRPLVLTRAARPIYWLLTSGGTLLVVGPYMDWWNLTVAGVFLYVAGTLTLLVNLVSTAAKAARRGATVVQLLLSYFWISLPAFLAPFVIFLGPERLPVARIELGALQGLINGWALQMTMVALPLVLSAVQQSRDQHLDLERGQPLDSRWWAVITLNIGVVGVWLGYFWAGGALKLPLMAGGYALIVIAWIPWLCKLWARLQPEEADQA